MWLMLYTLSTYICSSSLVKDFVSKSHIYFLFYPAVEASPRKKLHRSEILNQLKNVHASMWVTSAVKINFAIKLKALAPNLAGILQVLAGTLKMDQIIQRNMSIHR